VTAGHDQHGADAPSHAMMRAISTTGVFRALRKWRHYLSAAELLLLSWPEASFCGTLPTPSSFRGLLGALCGNSEALNRTKFRDADRKQRFQSAIGACLAPRPHASLHPGIDRNRPAGFEQGEIIMTIQ
jgi:hypothetical protein